jgi:uncharacterized protein YkwD
MKAIFRVLITIPGILFIMFPGYSQELLKEEALKAYQYLNEVRQNPSAFSNEIGVDLSYVEALPKLVWSNELAQAAEKKALDMASRDYFDHVDPDGYGMNYWIVKAGYKLPDEWVKKKSYNNFESLQAGLSSGVEAIKNLILDEGTNPPGHRNHLLGILPFWSNCTDAGIGMARDPDSEYEYYTCVLVAKHDY